jgi:uncharacterized protein (TIGR02996 family)
MIDLQAEAEKLRGKDWETFCGLVDTICQEPDNPTPKLVLADWLDENDYDWSGDGVRWAVENGKEPRYFNSLGWNRDQSGWMWMFGDKPKLSYEKYFFATLPMIFYDGPKASERQTGGFPGTPASYISPVLSSEVPMDLTLDSSQAAWLWLAVRFGQLRKEGVI